MLKGITNKSVVALGVFSAGVTIVMAFLDPQHRVWVGVSIAVLVACIAWLVVREWLASTIPREQANRHRILLALATDDAVQTPSRRRTAVGALAIETCTTENLWAMVRSLQGRLEAIAEAAVEEADMPTDAGLKQLRRKVDEWVNDRVFVTQNHTAFKLLPRYSVRGADWVAVETGFRQVSDRVQVLVEELIAKAQEKPPDEDKELRRMRRSGHLRELSVRARSLAGEMDGIGSHIENLRDTARASLLQVI